MIEGMSEVWKVGETEMKYVMEGSRNLGDDLVAQCY